MRTGLVPGTPWPRWAIRYATTIAGCALVVGILWWSPFHTRSRTFLDPPDGTRFASLPAVSPDGRQIACALSAKGSQSLWVMPMEGRGFRELAGTEGAQMPFWSPDGHSIGFFTAAELKVADAAGGAVRSLCTVDGAKGGAWSRHGAIVFAPSSEGPLFRVPDRGGSPEPVTKLNAEARESSHRWPQFLPDGSLLDSAFPAGESEGELHVVSSAGRDARILQAPGRVVYTAASGGMLVYSSGGRLLFQRFDAAHAELLGGPELLAPFVGYSYTDSARLFAAGPAQVLHRNGDPDRVRQLVWVDREGRHCGRLAIPRVMLCREFLPMERPFW